MRRNGSALRHCDDPDVYSSGLMRNLGANTAGTPMPTTETALVSGKSCNAHCLKALEIEGRTTGGNVRRRCRGLALKSYDRSAAITRIRG
ncbi:hypothetical protein ACFT1A_29490 [Rhodococcus sp. NPDC057135]|uniref:hypothetical protein n=1 Tax=Rhodococcus sp. NPDC057135 TaxID=3346028 RepID=UPI0036293B1E